MQKKEGVLDRSVLDDEFSSVTLNELAMKVIESNEQQLEQSKAKSRS